jgi:hypothetical protein
MANAIKLGRLLGVWLPVATGGRDKTGSVDQAQGHGEGDAELAEAGDRDKDN